jgi:hypothetical protein
MAPPPPPARRSRAGLWTTLGVIGALLVACCVGGSIWAKPYFAEGSAKVSAPTRVAGFDKVDDADLNAEADKLRADIKSKTGASSAVAGYWGPGGGKTKMFFALAVAKFLLRPDREIKSAFDEMSSGGLAVNDIHDYPTGPLGGLVQCGSGTAEKVPVSVCAWADHGSLGIAGFYNRDVNDSAKLFLSVRNDMQTRG